MNIVVLRQCKQILTDILLECFIGNIHQISGIIILLIFNAGRHRLHDIRNIIGSKSGLQNRLAVLAVGVIYLYLRILCCIFSNDIVDYFNNLFLYRKDFDHSTVFRCILSADCTTLIVCDRIKNRCLLRALLCCFFGSFFCCRLALCSRIVPRRSASSHGE